MPEEEGFALEPDRLADHLEASSRVPPWLMHPGLVPARRHEGSLRRLERLCGRCHDSSVAPLALRQPGTPSGVAAIATALPGTSRAESGTVPVLMTFRTQAGTPDGVDGVATVLRISVPGCTRSATITGHVTSFEPHPDYFVIGGVKNVDCGGSGSFSFSYSAVHPTCSPFDFGTWTVTGGTGTFAGLTGGGSLVGKYTGNPCGRSRGIIDTWTGSLTFA